MKDSGEGTAHVVQMPTSNSKKRRLFRRSEGLVLYKVRIEALDSSVLRRVATLNAALFRLMLSSRLKEVLSADYEGGCLELLVEANQLSPEVVPGRVNIEIDNWD